MATDTEMRLWPLLTLFKPALEGKNEGTFNSFISYDLPKLKRKEFYLSPNVVVDVFCAAQ